MKKVISFLFICLLCVSFTVPCFADDFIYYAVIDEAELISEDEWIKLDDKIEKSRQKYNVDVTIFTEEEMWLDDAMETAEYYYEDWDFGAGENDDGIMLYISKNPRKYCILTHGDGRRIFNENGVRYIEDNIVPHLKNNDYYLAMNTFADLTDDLLEMAANGEPYNEEPQDTTYMLIVIGCAVVIPLLIAFIIMKVQLGKMKTAVADNYAANYMKPGSKCIDVSRDIFLYSAITRTEKPKNDNEHKSSSGRTYGGSSGSY